MSKKIKKNCILTNLTYKWLLVLAAALIIFIAANIFFFQQFSLNNQLSNNEQTKFAIMEDVTQKSFSHNRFIENRLSMLELASIQIADFDDIFSNEAINYLSNAAEIAGLKNISVIDTEGNLYDKFSTGAVINVSDASYFAAVMQGHSYISELMTYEGINVKGIVLASPIKQNSIIIGAVATILDTDYLTTNLAQNIFDDYGQCFILDKNNALITNSNEQNIAQIIPNLTNGSGIFNLTDKATKKQVFCSYSKIGNTGLKFVAVVSNDIMKEYRDLDSKNIAIFNMEVIISFVVISVLVLLMIYRINKQKFHESLKFETAIKLISKYNFEYNSENKKLVLSKDAAELLHLPMVIYNPELDENLSKQVNKNQLIEAYKTNCVSSKSYKIETTHRVNNKTLNLEVNISIIFDKNEKVSIIGTFDDVSKDKLILNRLYKKINYDALTNLYSRDYIIRKITNVLESDKISEHGFMILDLDGFKQINDSYGHNIGDEVLIKVGNCIKQTVRSTDMVSRLGGDEYVVFLPAIKSKKQLFNLATSVYENILCLTINDNIQECISCSIGISVSSPDSSYDDLYKNADNALQSVKKSDSTIAIYEGTSVKDAAKKSVDISVKPEDVTINAVQRDLLIKLSKDPDYVKSVLLKAMEKDEFEIYLQPKFNVQTKSVISAEVLARWNSPQYGFVAPLNFINLFEKTNLINIFDTMILRKSIELLAKWQTEKININLSVNQSSYLITNANYVKTITNILDEFKTDGKNLTIEITERSNLTTYRTIAKVAEQLNKIGIKFSIDDFGSGNTTLNMLKSIKVDEIKLDRMFMLTSSETKEKTRTMIKNIVNMAKELKIKTVIEGVETSEQSQFLIQIGCNELQGYYYAKPMTVVNFENKYLK